MRRQRRRPPSRGTKAHLHFARRVKTGGLLPRRPDFVAESRDASLERGRVECEASALSTELTARNRSYFSPENRDCQKGPLASSFSPPRRGVVPDLSALLPGYILCARTEGKSPRTIEIVSRSVGYLEGFLRSEGLPAAADGVGPEHLRAFILYLQRKRCFSGHRTTPAQDRGSPPTP